MSANPITDNPGPASDAEVDNGADDLFTIMRAFDSPKDAASAFALAHYKLVAASFAPEQRSEAIAAVQNHAKSVIELLNDGWH